jgi:hypothetical protein
MYAQERVSNFQFARHYTLIRKTDIMLLHTTRTFQPAAIFTGTAIGCALQNRIRWTERLLAEANNRRQIRFVFSLSPAIAPHTPYEAIIILPLLIHYGEKPIKCWIP